MNAKFDERTIQKKWFEFCWVGAQKRMLVVDVKEVVVQAKSSGDMREVYEQMLSAKGFDQRKIHHEMR